ncbi:Acetyltransferase (GNAT) domain protein, partial [Quillaja saponaria]
TLRPLKISDVDDFLEYAGDANVTRFTRWSGFTSKEEAVSCIKEFCIPHPFCRSICINDHSIGFLMITPQSGDGKCGAILGYALAAAYWGQGIVPRALRMAISEGFKEFPHVVRLEAVIEVENKASQKVLDKIGFYKERILRKYTFNKGQVKDLVMYSLLSTDPICLDS